MKQSDRSRKAARLPESLHHRLNSYALAASAAGVSALALAQPAEAKIVYTVANIAINYNTSYRLHLDNRTGSAFSINNVYYWRGEGASNTLSIYPIGQRDAVLGNASRLSQGRRIGPNKPFQKSAQVMLHFYYSCEEGTCGTRSTRGQWKNATGFLGLKFFLHGKAHYGWARFNLTNSQYLRQIQATLVDYAYETVANKAIIAGKTKGPDVITVRPASLGHLAHGAAAIPAWRVKEAQ